MLDKCYRNIYLTILKFIPIDFHPVCRLVNSKFNRCVKNTVCRLNRIIPYANISLLKFIQTQPNAHSFTLYSTLQAGLYGRPDILVWLKQDSSTWGCHNYFLDVEAILKSYTTENLCHAIKTIFVGNQYCCEFLMEYGSVQQIKLFLDLIGEGKIPDESKSKVKELLFALAILTADMSYINTFEMTGFAWLVGPVKRHQQFIN